MKLHRKRANHSSAVQQQGRIRQNWMAQCYFAVDLTDMCCFHVPLPTVVYQDTQMDSYNVKRVTTRSQVYAWLCNIWLSFTL